MRPPKGPPKVLVYARVALLEGIPGERPPREQLAAPLWRRQRHQRVIGLLLVELHALRHICRVSLRGVSRAVSAAPTDGRQASGPLLLARFAER